MRSFSSPQADGTERVGLTRAYCPLMPLLARGLALTLALAGALAACPRRANAQTSDPDTLPTLDDSAPLASPDAPPPPLPAIVLKTPAPKPRLALGPIRAQRRLALTGEVGWNGIAGFGPNLTYHLHPHVSFDLGAGLSLLGWKVGLRGRYNLLTGRVTPFIGAGIMGAAGFGDSPLQPSDPDPQRETLNIKILPSTWAQGVVGVDWIAASGFTMIGCAGYAWLLSKDPVQVVTGTPNSDEKQAFDVAFRSNVVITLALGYSFR